MKINVFIIVVILLLFAPKLVEADSIMEIDDYNLKEVQNILDDNEYRELDFKEMVKEFISGKSDTVIIDTISYMFKKAFTDIDLGKECVANILLISIVSAFFTNFAKVFNGNTVSDTGFFICYIAVMTVSITIFSTAATIAGNLLGLIVEFMQALVPTFFLSVGMIGQLSAIGFYQIALVVILVVNYIFANIVMPMLKIYIVLAMANNISREDLLSKGISLIKRGIIFLNKALLGIVVGINVIQGLVLPQADSLKNTTIKKLAGVLPVVGDSSDYVTNVFLGSGMLIKNSLGTAAIVILFCICFIPVVKLFLIMLSVQISTAVVQPITDIRIVKSLSYVGEGIKLMLRTVMTSAVLFVISIAIVCVMTKV